jgi:5-methyltetrahydropteroyltriglutamate--homocysteine methyltransferase
VKSFHPETPEEVAARIRQLLPFVNPEKLYLNPDCGFGWTPRGICVQKLQALVAGAKIVRAELSKV